MRLPPAAAVRRQLAIERVARIAPSAADVHRRRLALGLTRKRVELGIEDLVVYPFDEWLLKRVGRELLVLAAASWLEHAQPSQACDVCVAFGRSTRFEGPEDVRASMDEWLARLRPGAERHVLLIAFEARFTLPSTIGEDGWDGHQLALVLVPVPNQPEPRFHLTVVDTVRRAHYVYPLVEWFTEALRRHVEVSRVRHVMNGLGVFGAPNLCVLRSLRAMLCLACLRDPWPIIRRDEDPEDTARFHDFVELQLWRMRRALLTDPLVWHRTEPRAVVLAHTVIAHGVLPLTPRLWLLSPYWYQRLIVNEPDVPLTMERMMSGAARHWQAVAVDFDLHGEPPQLHPLP